MGIDRVIVISILLLLVGLINFLPVLGVISADKLSSAYAIDLMSQDLIILMRHRALLFGLVGGFVILSVFKPVYQTAAMVMAAVSMLGFLYFVWVAAEFNTAIAKIAIIDIAGLVCLALAATLQYVNGNS